MRSPGEFQGSRGVFVGARSNPGSMGQYGAKTGQCSSPRRNHAGGARVVSGKLGYFAGRVAPNGEVLRWYGCGLRGNRGVFVKYPDFYFFWLETKELAYLTSPLG